MDATIARIVERRAISKSPIVMATDLARVECTLHNDPRLIEAVVAVVLHSAQRAGFSKQTQEGLAATVSTIYREAFKQIGHPTAAPRMKLVVEAFRDRLEVTVESPTQMFVPRATMFSAIGFNEAAKGTAKSIENEFIDRVEYEGPDGFRIKLIKYCDPAKSKRAG